MGGRGERLAVTRERRAGGADNCEYERAVRLKPATVVRRSVKGVAWSESALLAQSSDLSASECDIRVSTGVGALLIMWWGGARVVEYR